MSFEYIRTLPSAEHLKALMPISTSSAVLQREKVEEIKKILSGTDSRILLIIGPCSADNETAVLEYVTRLARVQDKVREKICIIPRVYTNKPRTTGEGYKGMLHQPDPNAKPNAFEGIKAIRRMHIRVLSETGFVTADEMLYPANYAFLDDILGYVAVGARSVENQQHRLTVSGLDVPAGMKNGTSGDLSVMFNAIQAAQSSHDFIYRNWEASTIGNPYAHAILRGGLDHNSGRSIPNYHYEDLQHTAEIYAAKGFSNPAIVVDVNHNNSGKRFQEQPRIISEIMHSMRYDRLVAGMIKGFMVESYLEDGSQKIGPDQIFGKSITDPCLGWASTESMIYDIAEKL